jgi:diketogulonate reductase-like aldo/keto reductase
MGYGTVFLKGREAVSSYESAINNGYRLLDSAYNYENEGTHGEAIGKSGEGPVINQIEMHPFFNQEEQRKWHDAVHRTCRERTAPGCSRNPF